MCVCVDSCGVGELRLGGKDVAKYEKFCDESPTPVAKCASHNFEAASNLLKNAEKVRLVGACYKAMKRLAADLPEQRTQLQSELLFTRTLGYKEKDMWEHAALEAAIRKALLMR